MDRHFDSLPEPLAQQFAELDTHIRRLTLLRGLAVTTLVGIATVGAAMLADLRWNLDSGIRAALLVAAGLCTLAAGVYWLLIPLRRRFTLAELAAIVEQTHPRLAERLLSTVELSDPQLPDEFKGSRYMRALLSRQTLRSAGELQFAESVSPNRSFRVGMAAAVAVVVLLAPVLWSPSGYGLLWARLLNPWGNYDHGGNLYFVVEGGDRTVARGEDVRITAEPRWRTTAEAPPASVRLNWTTAAGVSDSRIMELDEAGCYAATLPRVSNPLTFEISSPAARSREYRIDVADRPGIIAATLDVDPPAYTGRPAATHDGIVGEIPVFEHSRLHFTLEFNKPVQTAELLWLGENDSHEPKNAESTTASIPLELSADRQRATLTSTAARGGQFAFRILDEHGLSNADEPFRRIALTADMPPRLEVAGSDEPQKARPSDSIAVPVTAADDFGLGALELHYEVRERDNGTTAVDQALLGAGMISHEFTLDLAALGLSDGDVLTYKVRAADERPVPGPNETWSKPRVIAVSRDAPPARAEELAARREAERQQLEQIHKQLEQNRDRVADLHEQAAADQNEEQAKPAAEVSRLAREQIDLARRLAELAARVGEHPLFSQLMDEAQKLARDRLAEAGAQLHQAAVAAEAEQAEALQKNNEDLAQAQEQLEELQKQFEEMAALEQDLLALERLAQQAEALAQQAAQLQQNPQSRAALQQEQQTLAELLNDLLQRRPEILEAARQEQLDQLKQLAAEARELAKQQDQLADAVAQQQPEPAPAENEAQAASQTEEAQERQQNLVERAAALAMNVARQTGPQSQATQQATRTARETDEARRDVERGQLAQAGERLEQAAKSAAQTADQLQDQPASPELQNEARELAQALAEQSQQLAELSKSPSACRACQSAGQQQLAGATAGLGRQLAAAASRMTANPLNQNEAGQQAGQAQEATEQAAQTMNQASQQIAENQSGPAAESGHDAADKLRDAADLAAKAAATQGAPSPVPPDFAGQLADAARHLAEAQRELARDGKPEQQPSAQPSSEPPPPGSLAHACQSAAQALARAVQQLSPNGNPSPSDSPPGQAAGNGGNGAVGQSGIQMLEAELQRLASTRQWGQLSGELRTEILQAARKRPHSEYAHLIKLYFEEIARTPTEDKAASP